MLVQWLIQYICFSEHCFEELQVRRTCWSNTSSQNRKQTTHWGPQPKPVRLASRWSPVHVCHPQPRYPKIPHLLLLSKQPGQKTIFWPWHSFYRWGLRKKKNTFYNRVSFGWKQKFVSVSYYINTQFALFNKSNAGLNSFRLFCL